MTDPSSLPTVFLDRDGTINVDVGYCVKPERVELIDGAGEAIARLNEAKFRVVVVSNQSAIGRGFATAEDIEQTNQEVLRQLAASNKNATLEAIFFCPHHPDDDCDCRKPKTGMVDDISFSAERAWVVGDKVSDIEFGERLGIPAAQRLLVRTGEGEKSLKSFNEKSLPISCKNLVEAVDFILSHT